jgi:hypothetical protein
MRGLDSTATEQGPPLNPFEAALASRDMDVPAMVRAALARNRGQLAFQPIVTASNTRKIAYYEGLIRLLDDGNRIIPAGQFIASVEETTMGRDVDCVALALGLEKLRVNPALRPALLGLLFDGLAAGLRNLPDTKLPYGPRLLDSATWAEACAPGLGIEPGTILNAWMANRSQAAEAALEADDVAQAMRNLIVKDLDARR